MLLYQRRFHVFPQSSNGITATLALTMRMQNQSVWNRQNWRRTLASMCSEIKSIVMDSTRLVKSPQRISGHRPLAGAKRSALE